MQSDLVLTLTSTFEGHAQTTEDGVEYWLARDLQHLLGYSKWDNFLNVISKARTGCEVSGHQVSDHFADVGKTIAMPKGAEKEIPQIMLTRYACYPGAEPAGQFAESDKLEAQIKRHLEGLGYAL